jgi:argininosuccinate lyase
MSFAPAYVTCVLAENFDYAKQALFVPLMAIHRAHLVMLAECAIISAEQATSVREALEAIGDIDVRAATFDDDTEDLFTFVDRLISERGGATVAGHLHTARSRNDIDMTMYRMRLREFVLEIASEVQALRQALVDVAARHRDTVFAAHTHTQPAQPTTLAHYLLGVLDHLEHDDRRLRAAYEATNRSPLGACAITGTGFPIDRGRTSALLGFDGPTGNTYGSIATVDYLLEAVGAVAILLVGIGRVIHDLLLWGTVELGYLRLDDGLVQGSSIMPQKRNPVALEHARAIASRGLGQAHAVPFTVHNTPFGDIVDTEDDMQPLVAATFGDAVRVVRLLTAAFRGATFDVERMAARAARHGTTTTELADTLVRERGLDFKTARAIAGRYAVLQADGSAQRPSDCLAHASNEVLGAPIRVDDSEIERVLDARHFVTVRSRWGEPAPSATAAALDRARESLARDVAWRDGRNRALGAAASQLLERCASL